jgi:hypothetical protein
VIEIDPEGRLFADGLKVSQIELRITGVIKLDTCDRCHLAFVRAVALGDRRALAVDAFVNPRQFGISRMTRPEPKARGTPSSARLTPWISHDEGGIGEGGRRVGSRALPRLRVRLAELPAARAGGAGIAAHQLDGGGVQPVWGHAN